MQKIKTITTYPTNKLNVMVCDLPLFRTYRNAIWLNKAVKPMYSSCLMKVFSWHMTKETINKRQSITKDIPYVPEDKIQPLEESGIIKQGTLVKKDDILIGIIQTKRAEYLSPEKKLLHAIFGRSCEDVENVSICYPFWDCGMVTHVECQQKILYNNPEPTEIKVYVNIMKEITIGDVLQDIKQNKGVVSSIEDMDLEISPKKHLQAVIHPNSTMIHQLENVQTKYLWCCHHNHRKKYHLVAAHNKKTGQNLNYVMNLLPQKKRPQNLQSLEYLGSYQVGTLEMQKVTCLVEDKIDDFMKEDSVVDFAPLLEYEDLALELFYEQNFLTVQDDDDDDDDYDYENYEEDDCEEDDHEDNSSVIDNNKSDRDENDEYDEYEKYYK